MRGVGHQLLLPFLAPEEKHLVANVPFAYWYGAADGITGIVVTEQRLGGYGQPKLGPDVVQEGIRVETLVAMIQIPAAVELRGAALGDQLNLRTGDGRAAFAAFRL